jgi:transcriptional regulator with XRE-family HTH domain
MTNKEFAKAVGCHITTASSYRNGRRLPQVEHLVAIQTMMGVSQDEIMAVYAQGKVAFGEYLRKEVFHDE